MKDQAKIKKLEQATREVVVKYTPRDYKGRVSQFKIPEEEKPPPVQS